jgi:hypothetical protein
MQVGDSLSPQTALPGLRAGQAWTISSYSPMALVNNPLDMLRSRSPIEVLHARVEESESIVWNGRAEDTWLVVYRTQVGQGPGSDKNIRNRLWVRRDGKVLRQQVIVGDSVLMFTRLSDEETDSLRAAHQELQP